MNHVGLIFHSMFIFSFLYIVISSLKVNVLIMNLDRIAFSIKEDTDKKSVAFGTFVEPKNSVDLFKDPIGNVDQYVSKL